MDEELTPEQEIAAEYAGKMLMQGSSIERAMVDLVSRGWSKEAARWLVVRTAEDLRSWHGSWEYRKLARSEFLGGIAIAVLGAAMCTASILVSARLGTSFSIFAAAWGLFMLIGGIITARRGRGMLRLTLRLPFEQPGNTDGTEQY